MSIKELDVYALKAVQPFDWLYGSAQTSLN
jgi:hypothetical protein